MHFDKKFCANKEVIIRFTQSQITTTLDHARETDSRFTPIHISLTGGSTGTQITQSLPELLTAYSDDIRQRIHLWWSDERFVEFDSPDRNDLGITKMLGDLIPEVNIHRIHPPSFASSLSRSAGILAEDLIHHGLEAGGPNTFDLMIMGLGDDAHIASLFPKSPLLSQKTVTGFTSNSPKPPPQRVTMMLPTINNSNQILVLAAGSAKWSALTAIQQSEKNNPQLPVTFLTGNVVLVTDQKN